MNTPPSASVVDLLRLLVAVVTDAVRAPGSFNLDTTLRRWARRTAARLDSQNLRINLGIKRLLLVGSSELSHGILAQYPRREGLSTGSLKKGAMAFLASRALTISDDEEWQRRRAFNECVLEPGRPHEFRADFVRYTLESFSEPAVSGPALQAAMGRVMLRVVFGGAAPAELTEDVEQLFALVQSPLKRVLKAPWAYWRRARFYRLLRVACSAGNIAGDPSLRQRAEGCTAQLDSSELIEQVPHWMFTFTGSGTDLLTRTLAMITSVPAVHHRALADMKAMGPRVEAYDFTRLSFLDACLLEAAHLYPPVRRTFHSAAVGATVGSVLIPAGTEIVHLFPLFTGDEPALTGPRFFDPDRWMRVEPPKCSFSPFLGGARACPGKDIILLVCKVALAKLLVTHEVVVDCPALGEVPLPEEFPPRLAFRSARRSDG